MCGRSDTLIFSRISDHVCAKKSAGKDDHGNRRSEVHSIYGANNHILAWLMRHKAFTVKRSRLSFSG